MAKYKFVGEHPEDLASGQLLEPGESVNLTNEEADDPHNQALMADGKLIGTGDASDKRVESAKEKAARDARKEEREAEEQEAETGEKEGGS